MYKSEQNRIVLTFPTYLSTGLRLYVMILNVLYRPSWRWRHFNLQLSEFISYFLSYWNVLIQWSLNNNSPKNPKNASWRFMVVLWLVKSHHATLIANNCNWKVSEQTNISSVLVLISFLRFVLSKTAPVNPANVSAWAKNSTSISVQWSFDNSPRNVLGVLRGFRVRINEQYGGNPSSVTVAARDLSRMLTNLKPHTEYNVTVGAFTLAGETKSTVVRVRTLQDGR